MAKATIKKTMNRSGDHFYKVFDEKGTCLASFYFKPEETNPDMVTHQQYSLDQAVKFAKEVETGKYDNDIEEIVYETPSEDPA